MLFDTHCHIQFKSYNDDREEVIERSVQKGILMNVVGTQTSMSKEAVALAEKHEHIYASVGIHPIQHDVVDVIEEDTTFTSRGEEWNDGLFAELAKHPKVIGIGETGLDRFHIRKDKAIEEVFDKQKELFLEHVKLSNKVNKPLIIHVREAHDEMIAYLKELKEEGYTLRGTIHCFTGNWGHAQEYLALGLYLGFTGIITFPPKKSDPNTMHILEETIRNMPEDRILVETDSPYLTPQVRRGKRNEPWLVEECVNKIAEIREISFDQAQKATTENAKKLFNVA